MKIKLTPKIKQIGLWLIGALLLLGIISALPSPVEQIPDTNKKDLVVQTRLFSDIKAELEIKKSGQVVGDQEIVVSSQAMGKIKSISKKEGEAVSNGTSIVNLSDTISNYSSAIQRASNSLNRANLQYEQTKINMEKAIKDARLGVSNAENTLQSLKDLGVQNIKKAETSLSSSDSTQNSLIIQLSTEKSKISNHLATVLHELDSVFGVTSNYQTKNDDFDLYLSAIQPSYKKTTKTKITNLYSAKTQINNISSNPDKTQLLAYVDQISNTYQQTLDMLSNAKLAMTYSVDTSTFPQTQIDGIIQTIDGFIASTQSNYSIFNEYKKQVQATFDQDAETLAKKTAQIGYESTLISTQKQINDATAALESARETFATLEKQQSNSLSLSQNAIREAQVSYQDASKNYNKLKIKAPIDGVISTIFVDVGQEVSMGTPVFSILNKEKNKIQIFVNANEYKYLQIDQEVKVTYKGEIFTGIINSINPSASQNTLYGVYISINKEIELVGEVASVDIPVEIKNPIIPIEAITITQENKGNIYTLVAGEVEIIEVDLGQTWNNYIEILSELDDNIEIITSTNIKGYEERLHDIVKDEFYDAKSGLGS